MCDDLRVCGGSTQLFGYRAIRQHVRKFHLNHPNPKSIASRPEYRGPVLSDRNKKYLCTKLMKEEPIKEGFLSPDEHLVDYTAIHR